MKAQLQLLPSEICRGMELSFSEFPLIFIYFLNLFCSLPFPHKTLTDMGVVSKFLEFQAHGIYISLFSLVRNIGPQRDTFKVFFMRETYFGLKVQMQTAPLCFTATAKLA